MHQDDHLHGTHIAGVIGAVGNNALGSVGINWRVGIIACKFMDEKGVGTDFGAAECVNWCAAQGARVISASFGGSTYSTALHDAIRDSNALFVAAAGNGGKDQIGDPEPEYPAGALAAACQYYCSCTLPLVDGGGGAASIVAAG